MRTLMVLAALGLGLCAFGLAEDESSEKAELSKVSLGSHWFGPQLDVGDLEGRVVLLEFWGFN